MASSILLKTGVPPSVARGSKQPHFIHAPEQALAMAGIVSAWRDKSKPDDDPDRWVISMAIITRDAHVAPGEVHGPELIEPLA